MLSGNILEASAMQSTHPQLPSAEFTLIALLCILPFSGCKPRIGMVTSAWKTTTTRAKVHGIDDGSAYLGKYDRGNAIVIWTDILACGFPIKPTWDKPSRRAKYAGYVKSSGGATINVECYVAGRMDGSVKLDEKEYDLADGSLFLISFRSSPTRIKQINVDIYDKAPASKGRKQLIQDHPEIRTFFETTDTTNQ